MSEQQQSNNQVKLDQWITNLPFMKIFTGFRAAAQPGKLLLGLMGIVVFFLAGSVVDFLTPSSCSVVVQVNQAPPSPTELDIYAARTMPISRGDFYALLQRHRDRNNNLLEGFLTDDPINMNTTEATAAITNNKAVGRIEDAYDDKFDAAVDILQRRYEARVEAIEDEYKKSSSSDAAEARATALENTDRAYALLFAAMTGDRDAANQTSPGDINVLVPNAARTDDADQNRKATEAVNNDRQTIGTAIGLGLAYGAAKDTLGRGVFTTFVNYNMSQFHAAVLSLVRDFSPSGAWACIMNSVNSVCWLVRFHYIIAIILAVIFLAVWSVIGGAICRVTALQTARDEKLGPISALKFSIAKFAAFFTSPLIPAVVIVIVALLMVIVSLLGAIPAIGELLVGIFMGLALIGGFVIALIVIGVIGGVNLMYPTIAVEGSDGFDAISRAFSYLFSKPWQMIFYTILAAIYGGICYIFVRFFAFLLLLGIHSSVGMAVNLDGSAKLPILGKFTAMWAKPTFENLHAPVNWMALNWSESVGALLIWIWVGLVIGLVMSFVISFFFSVNTIIYFLLRQRVDGTDIEDVYVQEDVESLATEQPEPATEAAAEEPKPAEAESEQPKQEPSEDMPAEGETPEDEKS